MATRATNKDYIIEELERVAAGKLTPEMRTRLKKGLTEDGLCELRNFVDATFMRGVSQAASKIKRDKRRSWKTHNDIHTLDVAGMDISVTHHLDYSPDVWVLVSRDLHPSTRPLKSKDLEGAKQGPGRGQARGASVGGQHLRRILVEARMSTWNDREKLLAQERDAALHRAETAERQLALHALHRDNNKNTGLPCPNCGVKQERINMVRDDDVFLIRISDRLDIAGLKGLIKLLRGWVT